jgi:hypothetical protein
MRKSNIDEFIENFNKIHNYKYDYSNSKYINNRTKIEIIFRIHGSFCQSPCSHIKGHECSYCSKNKKMDNNSFIEKSILIHGNLYDYTNLNLFWKLKSCYQFKQTYLNVKRGNLTIGYKKFRIYISYAPCLGTKYHHSHL